MAVKMYFVLAFITVALPGSQAWVADNWNKYGVGYTSDDQINGMMWSQSYGYLLDSGYYGYSHYGCIVNQSQIIQTCSGPAVDIASISYLTHLTRQGYFTSTVTSISIRSTSVQTISKDVFANLANLQTVTIFNCGNLENIDKDMFLQNTELQRLIIQGTKISLVPDLSRTRVTHVNLAGNAIKITTNNYRGWFFPSTLTHLALMHNKIHWIPPGWINSSSLRTVSFAHNELPQFTSALGGQLTSLIYMGLEYNMIKKISKSSLSALSSAPNFVHLNLSNNAITFIEAQSFSQIPSLQILEMQHNALAEFQPDVFWNLPHVKHLDFHRNSLASIGSKSMMNLPFLEELRLHSQNVALKKIAYDAWTGIGQNLKYLYIGENGLISFPHAVLYSETYPSLLRIHADYNQITNFTDLGRESFHGSDQWIYDRWIRNCSSFPKYPVLTHLLLNNNKLKHAFITEFCGMDSLVYLYMQNNEIVDVTLCGLDSLVYLYLQNNAIVNVSLDSTTSSCSPALRELYLRNNKIEIIEAEHTNRSQLRSLEYMDIGINQLQHIPESLKRSDVLPAIRTLLLDNNRLTFLESGTFFSLSTLLSL